MASRGAGIGERFSSLNAADEVKELVASIRARPIEGSAHDARGKSGARTC